MFQLENVTETVYLLPEDGPAARQAWLDLLAMPTEGWILGYGFTMPEAFAIIADHEDKGIPTHLLLDYTQSRGPTALALIRSLAPHVKVGGLTLTTAGIGSKRTSQIFHTKGLVKRTLDGTGFICWDGSVNFSASGWLQANIARKFSSDVYAQHFIDQHDRHRAWAREHLPHYQVTALSSDPITAYFASLALDNVLADLEDRLKDTALPLIGVTNESAWEVGVEFGRVIHELQEASKNCTTAEDLEKVAGHVMEAVGQGCSWLAILQALAISPPPRVEDEQGDPGDSAGQAE